ncbi:CDP-glucose 4,6-dehydratase [Sporomusa malonica]|uniref:CDP-glucose 4,6-dehydratase n=1 Tax=Sporomusa malonica TaxID=112901 RepID=A0A1W2EVB7_9FIRM|nr:CDP-glucose 4,6-dehydratase [Sporomusa malonica]SMD13522.1 CDP-glucose 4,6-dehydratase [Sporomusa malonica]
MMKQFWQNKRVFLTGHTGFKGSWLSLWLQSLGAQVVGYSLEAPSLPSLFKEARVAVGMQSLNGDILDLAKLKQALEECRPEILIHMAAQSLVRYSYQFPIETLSTNIIGTANVLDVARHVDSIRGIVIVTSDKCYENRERVWGYREDEPMGGYDPYSCSKGCAELVIASYRRSFYSSTHAAKVASARAGNVIGGGDWSADRIIPDSIRALHQCKPVVIRNPKSIRPWQHVLEPLAGYLLLAQKLCDDGLSFAEGWNFGPDENHACSVESLVDGLCRLWDSDVKWLVKQDDTLHEAHYLKLDSTKANQKLGWRPVLSMQDTLAMTVGWYKRFYDGADAQALMLEQIAKYEKLYKEN